MFGLGSLSLQFCNAGKLNKFRSALQDEFGIPPEDMVLEKIPGSESGSIVYRDTFEIIQPDGMDYITAYKAQQRIVVIAQEIYGRSAPLVSLNQRSAFANQTLVKSEAPVKTIEAVPVFQ